MKKAMIFYILGIAIVFVATWLVNGLPTAALFVGFSFIFTGVAIALWNMIKDNC